MSPLQHPTILPLFQGGDVPKGTEGVQPHQRNRFLPLKQHFPGSLTMAG